MTSAKQDQGIIIHITKSFKNIVFSLPELKKLIRVVCDRLGGGGAPNTRYEISVAVVDDIQIRELSGRFLNRKVATDCLSFDLSDGDEEESRAGNPASRTLELVVNGEMAARQANLRGHSSEAELALYITHGLLHHFGFDDATPSQARKMHEAEDEILQQLGYGSVYNKDLRAQKQSGAVEDLPVRENS